MTRAAFIIGFSLAFVLGVTWNHGDYIHEAERANAYEHDLAICRYVVTACDQGHADLSGLTESARNSCGLPLAKVRP